MAAPLKPKRPLGIRGSAAAAAVLALACADAEALRVLSMSTAEAVRPGEPIVLRLDRALTPADGMLAVFIGTTDMTALFIASDSELRFSGREVSLPPGQLPLVVWQVQGAQWQEIHRSTLTVLGEPQAPPAAVPAAATPAMEVTLKSQVRERTRGSSSPSPRPTFSDVALRGGVAVDRPLGPISTRGGINVFGSSHRPETLRFGSLGEGAPRVDLADYRFDFGYGPAQLTVGHLGWGRHPLLLDSYSSRGLLGNVRLGERFDLTLNAMNGTSIVGYDNLFGLSDSEHRIHGASLGVEADPGNAGWLRGELSVVDASLRALNNFNRGEIPDAERSRGLGVRVLARMLGGRLRGDVALARNEYRPADDPQLSVGQSLTPLQSTRRSGRLADLAFDALSGWDLLDGWPLTVTPTLRYERVEPLYKVVGAFIGADQQLWRGGVAARFGAMQLNWARSRREDNLDNIASLLKTRTEGGDFTLAVPLAEMVRSPTPNESFWPRLTLQRQSNRQFALNAPSFEDSGLLPTHRPDQHNRSATAALAWSLGRYSVNYAASYARQDNRQPGRENADFLNSGNQISVAVAWSEALALNVGVNRTRQYSYERRLAAYSNGAVAGFDWRLLESWTLSGNYAVTRGDDSRDFAVSYASAYQTQLAHRFTLPGYFGKPMTGQWFVRHGLQVISSDDRVLRLQSAGRLWAISLGASLTMF